MNKKRYVLSTLLIAGSIIAVPAYAGFYITNTPSAVFSSQTQTAKKFTAGASTGSASPANSQPALESFTANLVPGSLKDNLTRIAASQGWGQVVWRLSYDYQYPRHQAITSDSLQGVMNKILAPYPLRAVIYPQNKVIVIQAK